MATPAELTPADALASATNQRAGQELSGVFKHLLAEHGEAIARVKRLGMRVDSAESITEHEHPANSEMAERYAALREILQTQCLLEDDARRCDLADAIAALDAINPGSPEWGPTFLQVSELIEAHLHEGEMEEAGRGTAGMPQRASLDGCYAASPLNGRTRGF